MRRTSPPTQKASGLTVYRRKQGEGVVTYVEPLTRNT